MREVLAPVEARLVAILRNSPNRPVGWFLRFLLLPFGLARRGPSDRLTQACAKILLAPSAMRERLTVDIFHGGGDEGLARLERAFALTVDTQPLRDRLRNAGVRDVDAARAQRLITDAEAQNLRAAADAVAAAIAVDDFSPEELAPRQAADAASLQWTERARQTQSVAGGGGGCRRRSFVRTGISSSGKLRLTLPLVGRVGARRQACAACASLAALPRGGGRAVVRRRAPTPQPSPPRGAQSTPPAA